MASADDTIAKLAAQAAGAQRAATASEQLEAAIAAEQAALAGLGGSLDAARAKLNALAASEYTTSEAYEFQVAAIKKLEAAETARAASAAKLANARGGIAAAEAQTAAQKKAEEATKKQGQATEEAAKHTAMLAQVQRDNAAASDVSGASLTNAFSALKAAGPEGYIAAVALTAVTAGMTGLIVAMVAGAGIAIEVTEKLSKLQSVLTALAGSSAGGAAAMKIVQDLGKSLPFSTDQVGTWAKSLMAAGFEGAKLKSAIEAVAAAAALMPETGAAAAEKMLKTLQEGGDAADKLVQTMQKGGRKTQTALAEMGLKTKDLAEALGVSEAKFKTMHLSAEQLQKAIETALKKKGKGPLEEMALTFPVMIQKLKEGFFSLFAKLGPAIEPFMKAVQALFGQFGKGSTVMGALGKVATEAFGVIFKYATMAVLAVSKFVRENLTAKNIGGVWSTIKSVLGFVVSLLRGIGSAIGPMFSAAIPLLKTMAGALKFIFTNALVLKGLKAIFVGLAVVAGVFIAVIVGIGLAITVVAGLVGTAIGAIVGLFSWMIGGVVDVVGRITDSFSGLGTAIVEGLSSLDFGAFVAKMTQMAMAGLNAFKSALGINSPSVVMAQMGGHLATGAAQGVDDGAPKVQSSTAKMLDPKALKTGKGGAAGGGKTVVFDGCTFGDVKETTIREWVLKALDEDGFSGPEGAPA